ncbi:leucyl aminopeptidase family protein [Tateyamaria sp. SN6-1]|uniref:leucyl aminopeptidase family protein n=1 Tax=Tateyamaria sp. SN6-1 TaxID=3092148 RepID=UPI0039F5FF4D
MTLTFAPDTPDAIPLHLVSEDACASWAEKTGPVAQAWVAANGFTGALGQAIAIPGPDGALTCAAVGYGTPDSRARTRFHLAAGAAKLPAGAYALATVPSDAALDVEALGWLLASYRFDRYKDQRPMQATLVAPSGLDTARIEAQAQGEALTRTLINTPASDMGPPDLETAAHNLANSFGATLTVTTGEDLLAGNFPLIHTVGRAADRAPRLIDMAWGGSGPALTLVGKGVCFDTGGLNLKPSGAMGLMKKDMGGAAHVLGLAHMIMATGLPVRLRVLIPAVENSVAGNAFRPGDILNSRKGLTVEINNTDAEGRLVLADALALGDEDPPALMISMATLTGAARVAVGPDLAPYYTDDAPSAAALERAAASQSDPVWRMPFHPGYESMIEPGIADLDNAPKGGFAGSITAALFLRRFVTQTPAYMHFDVYGWQPSDAPARAKGGVGQGTRALLAALPEALNL